MAFFKTRVPTISKLQRKAAESNPAVETRKPF
jgi:hypothetical protein